MVIKITESQFNHLKHINRLGLGESQAQTCIVENMENELDSDDVDLTSFKPRETLSSDIWENDKINSRVRLQLLDIADDFIDFLGFDDAKHKDVVLTGSICNFNWSEQSDIDMHIIYDFEDISDNVELIRAYADAKKNEWNDMHESLTIYGFNVELYVEDVKEKAVSKGVYSLERNEWLQKPSHEGMELPDTAEVQEIASEIATMIEELEESYEACEIDSDLERLLNASEGLIGYVHSMRKKQLGSNGEMSVGNIVYKYLRREEYMNRLYDLQNRIYDSLNSI